MDVVNFTVSASGGFEKDEVEEYISSLKHSHATEINELEEIVARLKADVQSLLGELDSKEVQLESTEGLVVSLKFALAAQQGLPQQTSLAIDIAPPLQQTIESGDNVDSLSYNEKLRQLDAEKKLLEEEKQKNVESTVQIGQVLIHARMKATEISEQATDRARNLLWDTGAKADELLSSLKEEIVAKKEEELEKLCQKASLVESDFSTKINEVSTTIDETVEKIAGQCENIMSYYDQFKETIAHFKTMTEQMATLKDSAQSTIDDLQTELRVTIKKEYLQRLREDLTTPLDKGEDPILAFSVEEHLPLKESLFD